MINIDATKLINPHTELFKWGPMPVRYHLQGDFNIILSLDKYKKTFANYRWPASLAIYKEGKILWVNETAPLAKTAENIFNEILQDKKRLAEVEKQWSECVLALHNKIREVESLNLTKLTNKEFLRIFNSFSECVIDVFMIGLLPETVSCGLEVKLTKELEPIIKDESERMHAMQILTAPVRASFHQTEECELAVTSNIEKHQKKYFWINNSYAIVKEEPVSYFIERKAKINSSLPEKIKSQFADKKREKKEIAKKYKIPKSISSMGDAIAHCAMWQDDRKAEILKMLHMKSKLLHEASRRLKVDYDDLLNYDSSEVAQMFVKKPTNQELASRRLGFGQIASDEFIRFDLDDANKYWDIYTHVKIEKNSDSTRGKLASRGTTPIVRGIARIVFDAHNPGNFKEGDILIAPFTEPEFINLMKKSIAIITDEGSLTSHAAITSRELGKLCIVGTKMSTKVFKDGDLVEVDANKGTITKIG